MTVAGEVYRRLISTLGPQSWWPGESPFEVMIGAILVQNTAWKNVERAIANLRDADLIDPRRLASMAQPELEELIRPAGYFRVKSKRLRNLLDFIIHSYEGSIDAMRAEDPHRMRQELLGVHGVGPETADSILLYALDMPVMVVDAYTKRIWVRHGWVEPEADYHQLQAQIAAELPVEAPLLNELHALLVNVGHLWCKPTPSCESCPLQELLPDGGIVEMQ